eukprot:1154398-Rhodomonas_salina.2
MGQTATADATTTALTAVGTPAPAGSSVAATIPRSTHADAGVNATMPGGTTRSVRSETTTSTVQGAANMTGTPTPTVGAAAVTTSPQAVAPGWTQVVIAFNVTDAELQAMNASLFEFRVLALQLIMRAANSSDLGRFRLQGRNTSGMWDDVSGATGAPRSQRRLLAGGDAGVANGSNATDGRRVARVHETRVLIAGAWYSVQEIERLMVAISVGFSSRGFANVTANYVAFAAAGVMPQTTPVASVATPTGPIDDGGGGSTGSLWAPIALVAGSALVVLGVVYFVYRKRKRVQAVSGEEGKTAGQYAPVSIQEQLAGQLVRRGLHANRRGGSGVSASDHATPGRTAAHAREFAGDSALGGVV